MPQTPDLNQLVKRAEEERKIVVLKIDKRSSHGYYNYKTYAVAVYIPHYFEAYEEQDLLNVEIVEETCGAYQEFTCTDLESILSEYGFIIIKR